MDLAATFFVSIYGLAALSGAILAWAEQTPSITIVAPPLAICALLLNERYRVARLGTFSAGLVGLLGVVFFLVEFLGGNEESSLLGVAHLLTIVLCVFLFLDKQAPQYWLVFTTSCLQVTLAAVLTSNALFGLLILIYMFWFLWTLSVFTLLLGRLKYGRGDRVESGDEKWVWPELHKDPAEAAAGLGSVQASSHHSSYRNAVQCDPHSTDINWRFICGVGTLSSAALLLGLIVFLLTPRLWIGTNSAFQDAGLDGLGRNMTGFSEKVQLSDFGRILESSAPVLELSLADEQTGRPVRLDAYLDQLGQEQPLLRGTVLGSYRNGEWLTLRTDAPSTFNGAPPPGYGRRSYVRQTIRLENIGTRTLFSLADPLYGFVEDQLGSIRITHANRTLQFASNAGRFHGAIRYQLWVLEREPESSFPRYSQRRAIRPPEREREREQAPMPPWGDRQRNDRVGRQLEGEEAYLICPGNLSLVIETATRIKDLAKRSHDGRGSLDARIARDLVTYLRDSGQYQYSLDMSVTDPDIDPIEDFLLNRRKGHCQYFATALALMLRAAKIPSRVITGFKGGIEYPEEGRLEVQQRHAHAWVEALIDDQWVTLDATPVSREESVDSIGNRSGWLHAIYLFFSGLWSDYVINLSFNKQQRDLYAPFQMLGRAVTEQLRGNSNLMTVIKRQMLNFWQHPEEWFSIRGGLTAMVLMLSLVGLYYLLRSLYRLGRRLILGGAPGSRHGVRIDFYEQYLKAVKPLGLTPKAQQTQLEFAEQVEAAWLSRNYPAEFLPLVREICAAFYRLRFGDQKLSPEQDGRIRAGLIRLEAHVKNPRAA